MRTELHMLNQWSAFKYFNVKVFLQFGIATYTKVKYLNVCSAVVHGENIKGFTICIYIN